MSDAQKHDANVFLPGGLGPVRRTVVLEDDYDQLRAELSAIKAGEGEAVSWRNHSANYAKGEKCPATIETLQAAWARDQELLLDQKSEISRLKETINQLRQKRSAKPASADCEFHGSDKAACEQYSGGTPCVSDDAVSVPRELLHRLCPKMDARHWHQWNASEAYQAACELRTLLAQSQGVKP